MQDRIRQWILTQGLIAGLEVIQNENEILYHLCLLQKEKGTAKLIAQHQNIHSIAQLKTYLNEEIPIYLTCNIRGVLHRKLDYLPKNNNEVLEAVFPSADAADFLVQQTNVEQESFVSIIRKEAVQQQVEVLQEEGLWVVEVFAGAFMLEHILATLPPLTEIHTSQQILTIGNGHLQDFTKQENPKFRRLTLGDEEVEEEGLVALCLAFLGLTQLPVKSLDFDYVRIQQEQFLYKKLFQITNFGTLGFFFIALLINYFLFEQYNTQKQELEVELAQQQNLIAQRDTLAKELQQKKALLGDQSNLGISKTSYYADQLAASLPNSIQLTNLVLFPQEESKSYREEEELPRYQTNKMIVKGRCEASVFYNNWKRNIQELDWVADLHNISYKNDKSGVGIFELEITIK